MRSVQKGRKYVKRKLEYDRETFSNLIKTRKDLNPSCFN